MMLQPATFLFLAAAFTAGYPEWKLAFNIHGGDGHNFGYAASVWQDDTDLGTEANAFVADYKSYDVTLEIANFIAIARHRDGVCDGARVWQFLEVGKTLQSYLDWDLTSRLVATSNYIYSDISPNMLAKSKDPIFNVDGALVFNWWYSNNGVRIGNSNNWCNNNGLPGVDVNPDNFWGLGNEVSGSTKGRTRNNWFDVAKQDCTKNWWLRPQGSDHSARFTSGTLYGQYAIYISNEAKTFPCGGIRLQISMNPTVVRSFDRIDKGDDNLLNYEEYTFSNADTNSDDVLSMEEYTRARAVSLFGETAAHVNVSSDFKRVDKNNDEVLSFLEVVFDIADLSKDGILSIVEFTEARAQELLGRSATDIDVLKDFLRIDKDGDEGLIFNEIAFDSVDRNKDGELSLGEYSLARAEEYGGSD